MIRIWREVITPLLEELQIWSSWSDINSDMPLHHLDIWPRNFKGCHIEDLLLQLYSWVERVHGIYFLKLWVLLLKCIPDQVPCLSSGITWFKHPLPPPIPWLSTPYVWIFYTGGYRCRLVRHAYHMLLKTRPVNVLFIPSHLFMMVSPSSATNLPPPGPTGPSDTLCTSECPLNTGFCP